MRKLLMLLFSLGLLACAKEKKDSKDLTTFLPGDAAVIFKLQNPDLFFSQLSNNGFLSTNSSHPLSENLKTKLDFLQYIEHKEPALLSFSETSGSTHFTYIQKGIPTLELDSVQNRSVETFTSEYGEIRKYTLEDKITFSTYSDSILILSDSRKNLENILKGENRIPHPEDFHKALRASSEEKPVLLVNHQSLARLTDNIFPSADLRQGSSFSNWTSLDIELDSQAIKLNGISLAQDNQDSLPKTINLFKGVAPASNELSAITPVSSQGFFSFTFENFQVLKQNLSILQDDTEEIQLLTNATEAGIIYFTDTPVFAVRALNIEIPSSAFHPQRTTTEEFHGIQIYNYNGEGFPFLEPLAKLPNFKYFLILDSFVVFAQDLDPLKEVITATQNNQTLANSPAFAHTFHSLSTEASLLWVAYNRNFRNKLEDIVAREYKKATGELDFESYPITAIQFISQEDFAHVHAVLAKSEKKIPRNEVSHSSSISLDAPLAAPPVFFNNHRTDGLDIAVQDIENTLYLISPNGNIHWKKKLQSPILGEIQQVDLYRNGRYQLAFATENSIQVIDREGNLVQPFPLEFRDRITQPLALFDYDNNRKYRFLVVQDKALYMYDNKGKRVRGFTFRNTADEIVKPPKHIRIGRKDYILIQEASGKLNILSRTGKHRIEVSKKISPSDNEWYEYNNGFISTTPTGELVKITQNGNLSTEDLQLSDNHRIVATAKTLVTLSDNVLRIKDKAVELDFGLYTEPQIFYLNNKIYISVTDTQAHKVYLFDSNAELLPGFPVYGNSTVDLGNADEDTALELVVMGDEDSVLVYEL